MRDATATCCRDLLADDARLDSFEEGRLFGGDWLRALGMVPNEYLYYFYYAPTRSRRCGERSSRGAFLLEQQRDFYARNGDGPAAALAAWRATRRDRERHLHGRGARRPPATRQRATTRPRDGGYEREAMAVLEAMALKTREVLILNTANRTACRSWTAPRSSRSHGGRHAGAVPLARPLRCRPMPRPRRGDEGGRGDGIAAAQRLGGAGGASALALHPLVPSVTVAREIFDGVPGAVPELDAALGG